MKCPRCKDMYSYKSAHWIYETTYCEGHKISYWRCIICGHRQQDFASDWRPENPMIRHAKL